MADGRYVLVIDEDEESRLHSLFVGRISTMCQKRNQPIIGYVFLGIACLSIMAVLVTCEPLPVSPLVEQCQERKRAPQGVLDPQERQIRYVGDIFRDCPNCPEMVVLPGGFFLMGASPDARWPDYSGKPYHPVTIAQPFAVGRFEVTFDEWDACVAEGACDCYEPEDEDWGRGRRPVINVSWEAAHDYLYWLGQKTDKPYRLLSEAEWEYAVRAGTTTEYYWGDYRMENAICAYENVGEYAFVDCDAKDMTMPVGSFRPNPFGLYDMIGNVQEWTADCWNANYYGAPADGRVWQQGDCSLRVIRGGSFDWEHLYSAEFYSSARDSGWPGWTKSYIGFRVARAMTVAQPPAPPVPLE